MLDGLTLHVRGFVKPRLSILGAKYSPVERRRVRRADVLLVWFPKTGGTWVRMMLNTVLSRHTGVVPETPLDFDAFPEADPRVPLIYPLHEDEPHWKRPEALATDKGVHRHKKIILLARDPRDTIVSLYFQMTKRWKVIDCPMDDFVWQPRGGIPSMVRYYNIWAAHRATLPHLHLARYEDVHADPTGELRRMVDFMGLGHVADGVVAEAVEASAIDRLREREASMEFDTSRLRPGNPKDPDSFKARRGKVGGYVDYLGPRQIEAITRYVADHLDGWYGYP